MIIDPPHTHTNFHTTTTLRGLPQQVDSGSAAAPACLAGTCGGHLSDAVLPFAGFLADGSDVSYTNEEMFAFLSPENDALPYTYDSFTWTHCDSEGYTFGSQADGSADLAYTLPRKGKQ